MTHGLPDIGCFRKIRQANVTIHFGKFLVRHGAEKRPASRKAIEPLATVFLFQQRRFPDHEDTILFHCPVHVSHKLKLISLLQMVQGHANPHEVDRRGPRPQGLGEVETMQVNLARQDFEETPLRS